MKEHIMGKYYAVWVGRTPGIYESWDDCKAQTDKFPNAKFKKLEATNKADALIEFNNNGSAASKSVKISTNTQQPSTKLPKPTEKNLTVDGAANDITCEYQAVWTTGEKAFASKTFRGGTNNIAEFLGLVEAIKYLQDNNLSLKIYTDSVTAMAWVRNKKANTTAGTTGKATQELNSLIIDAENYLKSNSQLLQKVQILKWETKQWGEIPADYGRK